MPVVQNRSYYWIVGNYNDRLIIIGAYGTTDEAYRMGYEKLDCPFDVVELPTKDKGKATGILKARRLEQTSNLDLALKRAKHQI